MKLTAGDGQFVNVPDRMVDHYLSRGWRKVESRKADPVAPAQDAPPKPAAPRRGRRKVSGDSGVDATE